MNPLAEARQKLAEAIKGEKTLVEKLIGENRDATPDEEKTLGEFKATRERLNSQIARLQSVNADSESFEQSRSAEKPELNATVTRGEFENEKGDFRGFSSFGEQLQAVRRASVQPLDIDRRLRELQKRAASGLQEGVGQDGGFLVQTDYADLMMKEAFEMGVLASRVRKIPLSPNSNGIVIPTIAETSRVNGSRWGGVQAYWEEEAAEKTPSKPKFGRIEMRLHKLIGLCYTTDELLQDAPALGEIIRSAFTEEFAYRLDDAILRGTGVGQPLGILSSPALISVAQEGSGNGAGTFIGMNAVKMLSRLAPRSRANAVWLMNADVTTAFLTMYLSGGHTDWPIAFQQASSLTGGVDMLFGRPVLIIEQASSVGTVGDVILADLSQYGLIQRGNIQENVSIHVKFTTDETAFRFVLRVSGQPLWPSAITPANGSATISPFVATATRS